MSPLQSQPHRLSWPLTPEQVESLDDMLQMLFKASNGAVVATPAVSTVVSIAGAMGPPGRDGEDGADGIPGPPGAIGATGAAGGGGGGALVLLEQHTASASAALDFTTGITSTYDDYFFELVNIIPSTNTVNLVMQVSTDGGSTWKTTNYHYAFIFNSNVAGTPTGSVSTVAANFVLAGTLPNAISVSGCCGKVQMFDPLNAVSQKSFKFEVQWLHTDTNRYNYNGSGWWILATAVNAVRFKMDAGNIASGTIRLYGIAKV